MKITVPDSIARFFAFARATTADKSDGAAHFGEVGLFLWPHLDFGRYDSTPELSTPFATTGGDGVHFGFLSSAHLNPIDPPIVMTVPMNFELPSVVVGASLAEFLALGSKYGYFSLEQLVYDRARTIQDLELRDYPLDTPVTEMRLLRSISDEYKIEPWSDPDQRLKELQMEFGIYT